MKLHLPLGLRSALLACFALVSGLAAPALTTMAGGVAAITMVCVSSTAMADTVTWDPNWNATNPPSDITAPNILTEVPDGFSFLSGENEPTKGTDTTAVILAGTAEGAQQVTVIAGAGATSSDGNRWDTSEGALDVDTWMDVTGGTYWTLAGGSYAQNYNGGPASTFTGDSHIQLQADAAAGTSPSVAYIIGGNYNDAQSAAFTGDSYISIMGGEVTGSLVGGGTSGHSQTSVFNGNSNIWVYIPLASSAAANNLLPGNLIVGGCAALANAGPRLQQGAAGAEGNSQVTIDLSGFTPEAGTTPSMDKIIMGDAWLLPGTVSNHTGSSAVTILDTASTENRVSFALPVVAGSYFSSNGSATLSGGTSLSITGGAYANALVGGSYIAGGASATSSIGGNSTLTLGGDLVVEGDNAMVVGGHYVNSTAATVSSMDITLNIAGGSYAGNIIGGSYIGSGDGQATQTTGNITLTVSGGSISGTLYGGSWTLRNNAESTNEHGAISIALEDGSILGNVYAGGGVGMVDGSAVQAGVQATSTQVSVSDAVTLGAEGAPITISGGVENRPDASSISGTRTLMLAGSNGYSNLANATFSDFNVVNNASDATIKFYAVSSDFTKSGAGTLTLTGESSELNAISTLTVEAGRFDTGSAWLTQGGTGLAAITMGQGASLQTASLRLADGAALTLDVSAAPTGGIIAVAGAGDLSLAGGMSLELNGLSSLAEGSSSTLLNWNNDSAPFELADLSWTNADEAYTLNIVDNTLVLHHLGANEWVWDGSSSSWSDSDSTNWQGAGSSSGGTPVGKDVTFNTPTAEVATVGISGDVAPASVTVDNAAGTTYIFEADGTGAITGQDATLTKENEGKLTVSLANTYGGGTTVNGGTLESTVAAADGSAFGAGKVTVNEGATLLASAEGALQSNELELHGGMLSYAATETRDLATAPISNTAAAGAAQISVASGQEVTWQYAEGSAVEAALGKGVALSGGGSLMLAPSASDATANVQLAGPVTLSDAGTTLALGVSGVQQLGAADAPVAVSLGEGTLLSVERPQAVGNSALYANLSGAGTLEFVNTNADANSAVQLTGDGSAFTGIINLGREGETAAAGSTSAAVLLDYTQGSPVGGADSELNLLGLSFATMRTDGGTSTTTAANVEVMADTTQFSQTAGLVNTFSGELKGDDGVTWMLDATGLASGGQQNTLSGDLSGYAGTLAARGTADSPARWMLGGDGAQAHPEIVADFDAEDANNAFIIHYADAVTLSGEVSGQANLSQQGAGTLTLTGENTSRGTLSVAEGSTVQIGSADDAGQWGPGTGAQQASMLEGPGTIILANGSFSGMLAAGTSAPVVNVDVAQSHSFDMGGNDGSLITGSITLAEGATLTGVAGDLTERTLNLTLGSANVGAAAAGDAKVLFLDSSTYALFAVSSSLTNTTAAINLDLTADGVIDTLRRHRTAGQQSYLTLTNGLLTTADDNSNVTFTGNLNLLTDLGLRIAGVEGGSLVLDGTAQGVYIAGEGEDPTNVTGYQNLGAYAAVAVMPGETLTLNLPGAPDPALDGQGAILNNLLGAEDSALVVNNTSPVDAAGEPSVAVAVLNNPEQENDTTFAGSMSQQGGEVEYIKTGAGTLRVGGAVTAHQLTAEGGTIALNGAGNALDVLELNGGAVQLNNGTTTVSSLSDTAGGSVSVAEGATLASSGTSSLSNTQVDGPGTLQLSGALELADAARLNGVALELAEGATLGLNESRDNTVSHLNGSGTINGGGTADGSGLAMTGTGGSFGGALTGNGSLSINEGAEQQFTRDFRSAAGWNLTNNGRMGLDFVQADGSNAALSFNAVSLGANSVTDVRVNTDAPTSNLLTLGGMEMAPGAQVNLATSSTAGDIVNSDRSITIGTVSGGQAAGTLGYITPDTSSIVFMLLDAERSTLSVDEAGNLVMNLVTSSRNTLTPLAGNTNSNAGADLLWNAAYSGNATTGTDIRRLLEALNAPTTSRGEADRILAAASGSGVSVLSSAMAADVERQLRGIRNRTTGIIHQPRVACKGALADDTPRIGAWISGEGDHRKLDADGYLPGYSLSSWGGTVGMDMSCGERLTTGLALTALYGDLDAHSADNAEGDFDRYYLSAFARMGCKRWQHTLVGTVGRLDADLNRSVSFAEGSYRTHGETKGWGYGLMYEIGYTIPMNEDAGITLQPIANVSWRYVDVDGYTERGSDAALRVDDQDYNVVTFGAGVRAQAQVGEGFFNRTGLLEGRALVKVDAGDRKGEAAVAMLGGGNAWSRVRSEKLSAVGVELGAGLTVPLGQDAGALFIDGSAELRNEYSNLNGTIGYRFEF